MLSNLLGNAIKFTPEGGTVAIHAERSDGELSVAVVDSGPGIAPDDALHVFNRYWQAEHKAGTGLGLYIAHGIVEAHGGQNIGSTPHRAARGSCSRYPSNRNAPVRCDIRSTPNGFSRRLDEHLDEESLK